MQKHAKSPSPPRVRRIVVHTPEPGAGAGQYVAEFVQALAATGEDVTLLCPDNFIYVEEVTAGGAKIVRAPARAVGHANLCRRVVRNILFTLGSLRTFWGTVRRRDIVHFQFALQAGLGLLFFLAARFKRGFVVLTVHDPIPHRWILPQPFRRLEMTLLRIGYSLSHRLIVHNQAGRRILLEQFHIPPTRVVVIPHGPLNLMPAASSPAESTGELKPLRLLAFGSLRENKGLHLSISAVQRLRQSSHERPLTLTIAGAIPNLMEAPYWDRCKRLIEFQPEGIAVIDRKIDESEITPLFAAHDAVLLPYVQFFSDSGVAMLALSQQRPIIATRSGGLGELLSASDCGISVEAPTVEALTAAIETARLAPRGWLRQKGLNGYSYAANGRSWDVIGRHTQDLYDSLAPRQLAASLEQKIILHTPEPGSPSGRYIEALSTTLAASGVPLCVVCPANLGVHETLRNHPAINVRVCARRDTQTTDSFAAKISANLRFVCSSATTLLRAAKPGDIVHFQYMLHLPFGLVFFACAWARRARIVFTVHDPLPHKFLFPGSLRTIEMATLRCAYKWSDVLIAHSSAGKRKLMETFGLPAGKIRVIVHGPYPLNQQIEPCRETNRLEVLFFGSLRENKAPHLAVKAVQKLAADGVAVRLTIAGQVVNRKEREYWARCRTMIDPRCAAIRLFEKFVPDEELPALFSNCHCFVLPYTTFCSDSGVAYMALANGKPIVSTGAGGLGWLLENSHGGIPISAATVEEVASALRIASDLGPAALERIGRSGADWLLENCGWQRVARETRAVYADWIPELGPVSCASETLSETVIAIGAVL